MWVRKTPALKTEAVDFSETLVSAYKSTRRCNPEGQNRHLQRHENLRPHNKLIL
jgi:hypothetical protein